MNYIEAYERSKLLIANLLIAVSEKDTKKIKDIIQEHKLEGNKIAYDNIVSELSYRIEDLVRNNEITKEEACEMYSITLQCFSDINESERKIEILSFKIQKIYGFDKENMLLIAKFINELQSIDIENNNELELKRKYLELNYYLNNFNRDKLKQITKAIEDLNKKLS